MNSLHTTALSPQAMQAQDRVVPAPRTAATSRIGLLLRRWRQRRAMHELLELDDRLLDDIGLTREQVRAEARKAAWFFEAESPRALRDPYHTMW